MHLGFTCMEIPFKEAYLQELSLLDRRDSRRLAEPSIFTIFEYFFQRSTG